MAKRSKKNKGLFFGTVGDITISHWRGIEYIKTKNPPRKGKGTHQQRVNESRFAAMSRLMSQLLDVVRIGFQNEGYQKTPYNAALGYNQKNALMNSGAAFTIDYSRLLVSKGELPSVGSAVVEVASEATLTFSWDNNAGTGKAKEADKVIVVAYSQKTKTSVYRMQSTRGEGVAYLPVSFYSGEALHTWMFFVSQDGKDVSTSIYTGLIQLPQSQTSKPKPQSLKPTHPTTNDLTSNIPTSEIPTSEILLNCAPPPGQPVALATIAPSNQIRSHDPFF